MVKIIIVDEDRCLGCKSCEIQCAMAHSQAQTLAEALVCDPSPQPRVYVEPAGKFAMPLQCRHCEDAPCITVCPTEAIWRDADGLGPVLMAPERCIGCKDCLLVCPFGVIEVARDGKAMVKCDLCIERTSEGQLPACVEACPTGAIQFVELDERLRRRRRQAAQRIMAGSDAVTDKTALENADGSDQG